MKWEQFSQKNLVHETLFNTVVYGAMNHTQSCITWKLKIKINWNFGNKLFLFISSDSCHKIILLEWLTISLSTPYRSYIPNLDFIIWKYLIYLWFPHNLFKILPWRFLLFERKFVWFLLRNWNWQLLGFVLNYFSWLLVGLGGWKEKNQTNRFKF